MGVFGSNGRGEEAETPRDSLAEKLSARNGESRQTVIGEEVRLVGTLYSSAEVLIIGQIEGDVECPKLIVGTEGRINGNVTANSVLVNGEVLGDINAGSVMLQQQSRVSGDISCQTIAIEHGAAFEGAVQQVYQLEEAATARPAANRPAAASRATPEAGGRERPAARAG